MAAKVNQLNPADVNMKVNIAGVEFNNPVTVASGTFGSGMEYCEYVDLNRLGAVTTKGVANVPWPGNPTPRIAETPCGMLNAIGLQNHGVDYIIENELPFLSQYDTEIIANIAGSSEEDYVAVIEKMNDDPTVKAFELNISCPNVKHGGMGLGTQPELAKHITQMCKNVAKKPVYVKLSPNVTDIVAIAKAVEEGGADGLVMINTLLGMRIDLKTGKPVLANVTGGLSGPAVKPVGIRCVYQCARQVNIPIIGVGGITSSEDVLEYLLAGASAVEVGAMNFKDPYICKKIIEDLPETLKKYGYTSVQDVIERRQK